MKKYEKIIINMKVMSRNIHNLVLHNIVIHNFVRSNENAHIRYYQSKLKSAAAAAGVSVNEYAIQAINEKIGREN